MKTLAHNTPRHERGQALAEFSLILPILLLVVFGIIDFGRVIFVFSDASTALRDAARKAEILGLANAAPPPSYADCDLLRSTALQTRFVNSEEVEVYYWDTTEPVLPAFDAVLAEDANTNPDPVAREASQTTLLASAHYTCEGGLTIGDTSMTKISLSGSEMDNGDLLRVHYTGRVQFLTPFLSAIWSGIDLDFYAQRTVVTQLTLGSTSGIDYDFDGLDDRWEFMWYGCVDANDDSIIHEVDEQFKFLPLDTWQTWTVSGGQSWADENVCDTRNVTNPEDSALADVPIPYEINTSKYNAIRDPDGDSCNMGCEENRNSQPVPYTFSTGLNDGTDTDGDGLTDGEEASVYFTNPSGGDWMYCDWNQRYGSDDGSTYLTTSDGVMDGYDSDCDGVPDGVEVGSDHVPQIEPNGLVVYPGKDPSSPAGWPYRPSYAFLPDGADGDTMFDSVDSDGDGLYDHQEYYDETPCDEPHEPEAIPYMCLATTPPAGVTIDFPLNQYYTNPTYYNEVGDPTQLDGVDTDQDGLTDMQETAGFEMGDFEVNREMLYDVVYYTHPNYADGENNGAGDDETVIPDPLNPPETLTIDGDEITNPVYGGYTDPQDTDTDDDGLSDYWELLPVEDGGYGSNPLDNDGDFDNLTDDVEADLASFYPPERNYTISLVNDPNSDGLGGADRDGDGFASTTNNALYPATPVDSSSELLPGETLVENDSCKDMNDGYEVDTLRTDPYKLDTDGDGLSDCYEVDADLDPTIVDSDGDGVPEGIDASDDCAPHDETLTTNCGVAGDADGDLLQDWWELAEFSGDMSQVGTGDVDLDEFGNPKPDGCDNLCEFRRGTDPLLWDTDGDGLSDGEELPDSSPTSIDTDGDGLNDGVEKNYTFGGTPFRLNARNQDSDGDGLLDGEEYVGKAPASYGLPNSTIATNAAKPDTDGDGLWDSAEMYPSATANDTVFNGAYIYRSFPTSPILQDTDGDGWTDSREIQSEYTNQPNPTVADTDGDGLDDQQEGELSFTYINDSDTDNDGLSDGQEYNGFTMNITFCAASGGTQDIVLLGYKDNIVSGLNPNSENSDGDTLLDGAEVNHADADKKTNPTLADTDNDGISDNQELSDATDPQCGTTVLPTPVPSTDTDGDGLTDNQESITGITITGWGTVFTDPTKVDSDGDTLSDPTEVNGITMNVTYYTSAGTAVVLGTIYTNPTHIDNNGDGQNDGLDSDLDGINDNIELAGTNSTLVAGATMSLVDCNDDDDYSDPGEFSAATLKKTNPADRDTDDDGMPDWDEISLNLNPLDGRCGPAVILAKSNSILDEVFTRYWRSAGSVTFNMTQAQAEASALDYAEDQGFVLVSSTEMLATFHANTGCNGGNSLTSEITAAGAEAVGDENMGGNTCNWRVRGTIAELIKLAFSSKVTLIDNIAVN
jgi:Flp pilus assembly protein TadG